MKRDGLSLPIEPLIKRKFIQTLFNLNFQVLPGLEV